MQFLAVFQRVKSCPKTLTNFWCNSNAHITTPFAHWKLQKRQTGDDKDRLRRLSGHTFFVLQKELEELEPRAAVRDQSGGSSQENDCNKGVEQDKVYKLYLPTNFCNSNAIVVKMLTNKLILFNTSSVDTHGDGGEARKRPNSLWAFLERWAWKTDLYVS